jgi:hypothetical protein
MNTSITIFFFLSFQTSLTMVSHCQIDITLIKKLHTLNIYILCPAYYMMILQTFQLKSSTWEMESKLFVAH